MNDAGAFREFCKQIIAKAPAARSQDERHALFVWVHSLDCKLFEDLSETVLKEICDNLAFETVPADSVGRSISDHIYLLFVSSLVIDCAR